jgi:D-xylulose 5-phosphate/D-fructose 6-phosphate phosphoketolase
MRYRITGCDVMRGDMTNFRVFGPDEAASNRLSAIYEATKKTWLAELMLDDSDVGELSTGRPRHGDAQRTHPRGLGGGIRTDRTPRFLFFL